MVSNPWNEISGISIRAGNAEVQENVLPTHRWMLDGVTVLISAFAQYLPDMDLAFNLNDECRVAVPYEEAEQLRYSGEKSAMSENIKPNNSWSSDRTATWEPLAAEPISETIFQDHSFRNTFDDYGSIGCPTSSPARNSRHWNHRLLCTTCTYPHSLGQFLSNWSLASNICHQPDLASLHGFYLSPAAFKTSHLLMPVFSQSKAFGYNDILYPSAWNYMDKAKYDPSPSGAAGDNSRPDPPFAEKENVLFWRGATSEGVSGGEGTWRGMARQRLVHMSNNLTSSDLVTILLPHSGQRGRHSYQVFPGTALATLGLQTDIRVVDHIARCGGIGLYDCTDQEKEFGVVAPSDFQDHWRYKYLFDLDGAGFSGRFLPFLQSHSLPFKTALFREWYDSRLTAWRHFVPQDLRLHGVWSTLAYFAGVNGKLDDGREVVMGMHEKEGEMIAEEGSKWASKVLRKEDMEIYFFRLLLEWGRLTDDRRDELGFSL